MKSLIVFLQGHDNNFEIPKIVETISSYAFFRSNVESINFENIKTILEFAFANSLNLKSVTFGRELSFFLGHILSLTADFRSN